ncbi:hypothetical protein ES703_120591 [subsurface metagenome]
MLELASCRECGGVKPCIPFRGVKGLERIPYVNYCCPECDEATDEWLDGELQNYYSQLEDVGRSLKGKKKEGGRQ